MTTLLKTNEATYVNADHIVNIKIGRHYIVITTTEWDDECTEQRTFTLARDSECAVAICDWVSNRTYRVEND